MANDMVTPDDLSGLPGAPFTDAEVDAAVQTVRNVAGWHIAPEAEDTVTLDVVRGETVLRLPTRKLVSIQEIRDVDTSTAIDPSRYRVSASFGQVRRKYGFWPCGYGRVEVDMTHGYAEPPADLLALLGRAVLLARSATTESSQLWAGPFRTVSTTGAVSGSDDHPLSADAALERYALWWQPGIA